MAIPRELKTTGKVYIKYVDDKNLAIKGDIMLLLNDDATSLVKGNYYDTKISGYIKANIYDGKVWQIVNIDNFCEDRENRFHKKQYAIDSANICKEIIESKKDTIVYRTYRCHYSTFQEN